MSNLTTFSKILILLGLATFASMLVVTCYNCTKNSNTTYTPTQSYRQPVQDYGDYQVVNSPSGQQVVVVKDNSGQEFFMNYMMFQTLMNSGGIGSVRNYYGNHRYDPDWDNQQSTYRSITKTTINNYYGSQNVDDSKPDQIKYNQSKGFGSKSSTSATTVPNTSVDNSVKSNPSKGFSGKWFESSEKTSTPAPLYKKSNGFGSTNTPTNSSSSYKPSSGFGSSKSNPSPYKPSSGFGSGSKSSSSTSVKPSKGFGKKN